MRTLRTVKGVDFLLQNDGSVTWTGPAGVDADGDPRAYKLDDTGLDLLANAGYPHDPEAYPEILVVDAHGRPVVQGDADPAPGYLVSKTAYEDRRFAERDPRRYMWASRVTYIVVPAWLRMAVGPIVLGCRGRARNLRTGAVIEGPVGDLGPQNDIGEVSIAAAVGLGINPSPRAGGTEEHVVEYAIWPGVVATGFELLAG